MLRLTSILVLAISALTSASVRVNITKEYETVMNEPFFLKSGKDLITILRNVDSIQTLTTAPHGKMCAIPIEREEHAIDQKMKAHFLGNGKIIVYGSRFFNNPKSTLNWRKYVIHIIDPMNCTEKTIVSQVEVPEDQDPKSYASFVPYMDTFDIFFPRSSVPKCNPCRYNHLGESVEAPGRFPREIEKCLHYFVRSITEFDPSDGYFYSCTFEEEEDNGDLAINTMMKLLDSRFMVVRQRTAEYPVHDVSTAKGTEKHIGICYEDFKKMQNRELPQTICEFLDSNLKPKKPKFFLNVTSRHDQTAVTVGAIKILTLEDGNAWIALSYAHSGDGGKDIFSKIFVQYLSGRAGLVSVPLEIRRVNTVDVQLHQLAGLFDTNDYCVFIVDLENLTKYELPKVNVRAKCFDPKENLIKGSHLIKTTKVY